MLPLWPDWAPLGVTRAKVVIGPAGAQAYIELRATQNDALPNAIDALLQLRWLPQIAAKAKERADAVAVGRCQRRVGPPPVASAKPLLLTARRRPPATRRTWWA